MFENYLLISKITPQTLDQYWSTLLDCHVTSFFPPPYTQREKQHHGRARIEHRSSCSNPKTTTLIAGKCNIPVRIIVFNECKYFSLTKTLVCCHRDSNLRTDGLNGPSNIWATQPLHLTKLSSLWASFLLFWAKLKWKGQLENWSMVVAASD